ncbi:hypothetical protein [Pedosphaera parvula]|uniref:Uncharacterized protein n=1 Tax=Pedosphaera parvula (strain Ellin514) TaxID=320771 RepID=B9XJH5_PEDPL|nr:hypothetical protein [Pedosphaera parvula]EEF60036.1 hypothetical protein Cflav_PD3095 [Pedosphaera parvula Ellin514]
MKPTAHSVPFMFRRWFYFALVWLTIVSPADFPQKLFRRPISLNIRKRRPVARTLLYRRFTIGIASTQPTALTRARDPELQSHRQEINTG